MFSPWNLKRLFSLLERFYFSIFSGSVANNAIPTIGTVTARNT